MNTFLDHQSRPIPNRSTRDELDDYCDLLAAESSVDQIIADLVTGDGVIDGRARELCSIVARRQGRTHVPRMPVTDWRQVARRDMTAGIAASGGYAVSTKTAPARAAMVPYNPIAAVAEWYEDQVANITLPIFGTPAAISAVSTEADTAAEITPIVSAATLTPHTKAAFIDLSHLLIRQAPAGSTVVADYLARCAAETLGTQAIAGTGGSGQLLGVLHAPGVTSVSGSTLGLTGITDMIEACLSGGAREDRLMFIAAPDVRKTLSRREKAAGSGLLWADGKIDGVRAIASRLVPAGTLVLGDWAGLAIAIWGGLELSLDGYTNFRSLGSTLRVAISCDVAVTHPSVFAKSETIT